MSYSTIYDFYFYRFMKYSGLVLSIGILTAFYCSEAITYGQYAPRTYETNSNSDSYKSPQDRAVRITGASLGVVGLGTTIGGVVAMKKTATMISVYDKQLRQDVGSCRSYEYSSLISTWERSHPKEDYTYVSDDSPLYPYSTKTYKEYKANVIVPLVVGPVLLVSGTVMLACGYRGKTKITSKQNNSPKQKTTRKKKMNEVRRELELSYLPGSVILYF